MLNTLQVVRWSNQWLQMTASRLRGVIEAQALSNTVWALSKLAVESRDSVLLDAVAVAMLPVLPEFNAQNIANTVCTHFLNP